MSIWRDYNSAKIFIKTLKLRTSRDYNKYIKPIDIPKRPDIVYKEWESWSDFLGTNNLSNLDKKSKVLTYKEAKIFIEKLDFNNRKEFFNYYKLNKITEIPGRPDLFYDEWENWGEFLGNNNISHRDIKFIPIEDVVRLIKENNIKSHREWQKFYKKNKLKCNIPLFINKTYGKSYFYFFGNIRKDKLIKFYFSYEIAKYLCDYYSIKTNNDWVDLSKVYKKLPPSPDYYSNRILSEKRFISYERAKEFYKKLKINNISSFLINRPKFIPRHPKLFYKEWKGWQDFLGYEDNKLSKGEILVRDFLIKNKIEYVTFKKFKDCIHINQLIFDFYLTEKNTIIEFDGKQHFFSVEYFGGDKYFEMIKKRDKIKNSYCLKNNIKIIRISYFDINNINEILKNSVF